MIRPYTKPRPERTLALLLDGETVLRENGQPGPLQRALDQGVLVYAAAPLLRQLTRDGHGSALLWRFAAIGWNPSRTAEAWPVRGLQLELPRDPAQALHGLRRWRDWLQSYGAAPAGSLGGTGLSLLRATLARPLWTAVGELPPIRFTLGARQEAVPPTPRLVRGRLRHCDMVAAYASTLGRVRYGGTWTRQPWGPLWRKLAESQPDQLLYFRALVDVPELRFGPLPVRPRRWRPGGAQLLWNLDQDTFPSGRRIQGTWSWPELQQAERVGCRIVRVLDVWYHAVGSLDRPFEPWFRAIWKGRELGGFAAALAKATGNATWGQFSISPGTRVAVSRNGTRKLPLRGGNPSQRAYDLAEWIAGSVRSELHAGMSLVADDLICAHTDGLWTQGRAVTGWRVKEERDADELRLIDAQHLAYRRAGGAWQYVVAGVLDPEQWFEQTWARFEARGQVAA